MRLVVYSVIVYAVLLVLARLMGKRQVSELTYLDWVVGVSIGSLAAATIYSPSIPLGWGLAGLATLALLEIGSSYLVLKNKRARDLLSGKPTVLVRDGQPQYENMARERFNFDNLLSMLREKQVTRLADVEMATLETDGQLGLVLRQQGKQRSQSGGGSSGATSSTGGTKSSTGGAKPGPQ